MTWKILRGFISVLSSKIMMILIGFLITPLLVRLLGSANYGDYAFIMSLYGMIMIFVHAGADAGLRKFIAEDRQEHNWKESVFGFYTRVAIIISLLISLIVLLTSVYGPIDSVLGEEFIPYFMLMSAIILFAQLFSMARSGLMGLQLEHYAEPLKITKSILFGIVGLILVYYGYGVSGALLGQLVSTVIVAAGALYILHQRIPLSNIFAPTPRSVSRRNLLSYNFLAIIIVFLSSSLYHTDILLLQPLSGSQQTGYYRASLQIAEFLWFAPIAIQTVFLYSTSKMWSNEEFDKINLISSKVTRYTLLFTALLSIGLVALADPFIPLYFGAEFSASITPLILLLPGVVCFAVARPIISIGQGKGTSGIRILIFATGGSAILNLLLNLLLIPRFGMHGAAVATSIGYGSMLFFHIFAAFKVGFNPVSDLRMIRVAVTILSSGIIIVWVASLIGSTFISLILIPPFGFVLFSGVSILTGAIDMQEIHDIVSIMPNRYWPQSINRTK